MPRKAAEVGDRPRFRNTVFRSNVSAINMFLLTEATYTVPLEMC